MRLGVVGGGGVGRATARAFIEHVDEVRVYDVVAGRRTHPLHETLECDLTFVCLPTPQREGSLACDTSAVESFFAEMRGSLKNYVLRSTVPVGTTRMLREKYDLPNLVHSPEFITARCAVTDAQLPARNIVGAPAGRSECVAALAGLYRRRFPGVPVFEVTSDESELVKLAQNAFFLTKIAFWNECRTLADAMNLDWDRVMAAILADGRIAHSHTKVPGPDGKFGAGGACLIKDNANLVTCIESYGLSAAVTRAAHERNLEDRRRGA
jgi:UDPglucose 6-dehydrogenase